MPSFRPENVTITDRIPAPARARLRWGVPRWLAGFALLLAASTAACQAILGITDTTLAADASTPPPVDADATTIDAPPVDAAAHDAMPPDRRAAIHAA